MKWHEAVAEMAKGKVCECAGYKVRFSDSSMLEFAPVSSDLWSRGEISFELQMREWSEYTEPFKVGDWVKRDYGTVHIGNVTSVHGTVDNIVMLTVETLDGAYVNWTQESVVRITPEEVEQEKERRKWAVWGRDVGEFRPGDIVSSKGRLRKTTGWYHGVSAINSYGQLVVDNHYTLNKKDAEMICPREQRADWSEAHDQNV